MFAEDLEDEIVLPSLTTVIETESKVVEQKQILTAEEIQALNVESLTQLLESAGIQLLSYGTYGLETKPSIRGFTDETVRVIIDGICMNNAQYGTFDFSIINIEDIEKIEIVRGGFTEGVSDEGAVGGAIYITTRKQDLGHHFFANTSIKTFFNPKQPIDLFSQSLGYNGQIGESTFVKEKLKGTLAANKYLYVPYRNEEVYYFKFAGKKEREHAQVQDAQNDFKLSHYFGDGNCFTISDLFYAGNKNTPGPEFSENQGNQKDLNNAVAIDLVNPLVNDSLLLQNTLAWIYDQRLYNDSFNNSKHNINTLRYVSLAKLNKFSNYNQTAGITFDYTNLNSTDDGNHNQFLGSFKETSQLKFEKLNLSVPLAIKFCNKNVEFIPKAGISINLNFVDLVLDFYRMVQFPNMDDLYWDDGMYHGNPDLNPEKGWGGEITFNAHNIFIPFSLCVFSNYYSDKIQWVGTEVQNVSSAYYLGVDLSAEKSFLQEKLNIKLNGEYLFTKLMDKKSPFFGKKIMWTPDFTAGLSAIYSFENVVVSLDGSFTGKRYTSNLNTRFMKPYFLLNCSCEIKKFEHLKPYARLENMLNTSYRSVDGYPMGGIALTIGCKYQ